MPKEGDVRETLLRLSILVAVAVMLAACGGTTGSGSSSPSSGTIKAPSNLITAGTITFLSDTTYPPQESIDPSTNKAVGFDVDVANAIASKMGLTAANGADCSTKKITIQTFPTDTDAVQKLKLGAVDAAMDDSPVAAYYVKQDPTSFAIAGKPIAQAPEGIAVDPKNQELLKAIQQAMQAIFNDGTYKKLLQQWNLQDGA